MDDYITPDDATDGDDNTDLWADAIDGMLYETVSGSTYKAYVLLVKDPTRVFVGTSSSDYKNATAGICRRRRCWYRVCANWAYLFGRRMCLE